MAGLSFSIAMLLKKLDSVIQSPGFTTEHKKSVLFLNKLRETLVSIGYVITEAERKQENSVYDWLDKVEDAVYDAEDVLDEILYEAARFKLEAKPQNPKVLKAVGRRIIRAFPEPNEKSVRSIKKIVKGIEAIAKEKDQLGLSEGRPFSERDWERFAVRDWERFSELPFSRSESLPVSNEAAIYGREEDRSNVVRLLLSEDENVDAIAIVGVGGLGKTTLAQLVYNDEKVSAHFEQKAWIAVCNNFDFLGITRKILEAVTLRSFEGYVDKIKGFWSRDDLGGKLTASLAGKKFLLVLDEVGNVGIDIWDFLQQSLRSINARGSKIIVTSRSRSVATLMGCSTCYDLDPLTVKDCWSILENSAFARRDRSEVKDLELIGREIVMVCKGLPLLVRAIGGLLCLKRYRGEWLGVLEDLTNEKFLKQYGDSISPILWLSYYHLSAQLKCCFAYCSLFPKGYEFDKEELVVLWMAEGFLQQPTRQSLEKLGAECFNCLLNRSFFIPGDNSHFKMHDLMHDLAVHVSKRVCFGLESRLSNKSAIPKRTRHLSLLNDACNLSDIPETNRLRTFCLSNSLLDHVYYELSSEEFKVIFARQQRLRVLWLPSFQHAELPSSTCNLKHLRCLNVSNSALRKLPESLCTLYYLQTLILTKCSSLLMLPQGIVELVHLRKLYIKGAGLKKMPEEMGRLTSLQRLTNFIVGLDGSSIKELGALPNLHGSLSVSMLENVSSASDASAANLKDMQYLDELELEWSFIYENSARDQEEVLENLKPSEELKKLLIRFYSGSVFPNWLGHSSSLNITSLHLRDCRNIELMPPLGRLSRLKHLIIEKFSGIKCIGHEFYGVDLFCHEPFNSLKILEFRDMSRWEEWKLPEVGGVEFPRWEEWKLPEVEGVEFPRLEEFYIIKCPVFRGDLPKSLPNLTKLEIAKCKMLMASLPRTSERCVLKLDSSCKVQVETQDKIPSKTDDEVASHVSSSMAQILGNEIQLEWNVTKENPAEGGAMQEDLKSSGKLKKLSIGSYGGTSEGRAVQGDPKPSARLEEPSVGSYGGTSGGRAVQGDPKPSERLEEPSIRSYGGPSKGKAVQEDQEPYEKLEKPSIESYGGPSERRAVPENQEPFGKLEKPLSSDDGNQQFSPSLSLNFSSIGMAHLMELPKELQSLRIERYASNMLPKEILERYSLQHLYIIDSIPLKIFPLSPSLKTLYIHNCKSLEFPQPDKVMNQALLLEDLCLGSSCDSLKNFVLNYFPKLKALSLWDCRNLECVSIEKELQTELTSLDSLKIKDCPNLRSFLEEEFQAPNLTSLVFFNCGSLKSLQRMQSLKSLQSLYINKCPALESLPEEGLPSSLVILCVSFCDKIIPQKGWKLDKLHSLSHFEIEGGCQNLKSFPESGLLPTNLNSLRISRLLNLTSLDQEGLQKLTSLQTLEINCCNKLDSFPEYRLPSSLSSLSITDCSLLNPKLQNRRGKEWFKIAHIPSIHLDEVSD